MTAHPQAFELVQNVPAEAVVNGARLKLGVTDSKGELVVDLPRVLGSDVASKKDRIKTLYIELGGAYSKSKWLDIDLGPFYRSVEDREWKRIDIGACRVPKTADACDPVVEYRGRYPTSAHDAEASALLEAARPALEAAEKERDQRAREAELWEQVHLDQCRKPQSSSACEGAEKYLAEAPNGPHAGEIKEALKTVNDLLSKLRAKEAQNAKQREAREAREQRAEEARRAREEREDGAKKKRECLAGCGKDRRECDASCVGLTEGASLCRSQCRGKHSSCELDCR